MMYVVFPYTNLMKSPQISILCHKS
uniref:Uncharacterized protein n=1 Tax=Arundo donax TaxID=35708 RepID=A0A0A8YK39_ARUDO